MTASNIPHFAVRKRPRQRRSQIVVDMIVSTAATLFEREGYAYVSTNMIAATAHLSIGSVYQYFANRESIALAVHELACADAALQMKHSAVNLLGLPLDQAICAHISTLFDIFDQRRYALIQILDEVPELRAASQPISFERLVHQTLEIFLRQHFAAADPAAVMRIGYFLERATIAAISRYLDERPDIMTRDEAITEISDFTMRYVLKLAPPARIDP